MAAGALSGVLAALALPPFQLWPLAVLAMVPLVVVLARPDTGAGEQARAGLAFGVAFYGLLLHWIPPTLASLFPGGLAVGLLGVTLLVGVAGVQAWALGWLLRTGAAPAVLALPAVWVSTEFLLARAGPLSFPWTPLGLALAPVPTLAAPAEWGGVAVLSFWILAVNGLLAEIVGWAAGLVRGGAVRSGSGAVRPRSGAVRPRSGLDPSLVGPLLVLLVALPAAWGIHRTASLQERELEPVALAQLELSREVLLDGERRDREVGAALERILGAYASAPQPSSSVRSEASLAPSLLILPEAPFATPWEEGTREWFADHARTLGRPILVGARFREEGRRRNGVLLLDEEGRERFRHGKLRLVPAAEWPEVAAGPDGGVARVDGLASGVLICFESGFGSRARSLVRGGADLLANPTIDAWFRPGWPRGREDGGWTAAAHLQHRAHLILRAVETRRGAVRSAIGGELLVVDPSGRIRARRAPGSEGVVAVRPRTTALATGFVRFGELGGMAALLLLGGLALRTWLASSRSPSRPSGPGWERE